jgi:hypothetical protein
MPFWRHLSRTLLVLAAALVPWALVPAAADAATLDTVESTVGASAPPVQSAAEGVAAVVRPVVGDATGPSHPVTTPSTPAGEDPVAQTVDPIAGDAAAAVPATAATAPQFHLHEPATAGKSRIAASASVTRRGGSAEREQGSEGDAGRHPSPQRSVTALDRVKDISGAAEEASRATAEPLTPAPEPGSDPMAADADAFGAAAGFFFFGGGFALLVAWLLLAGPRLRRGLSKLPVGCRPVAFLVVLERPG